MDSPSSPSWISSFHDYFAESAAEITAALSQKAKIDDSTCGKTEKIDGRELGLRDGAEDEEEEEEEEDEEEFSFACVGSGSSPIAADDAFQNGQIRPFFPLFDQSLLYAGESAPDREDLPHRPSVNKVFIETEDLISPHPPSTAGENSGNKEEAAGPYCAWSRKAVEASPEVCKKSNSTGFSKLWRFHDLLNRSNSDGRDAFVFLNGSPASSSKKDAKSEASSEKKHTTVSAAAAAAAGAKTKPKAKKGAKGLTAALKAHEQYLKNREEDRRRSYLPYRPELMGFFTNVNGGLTRNVHPF